MTEYLVLGAISLLFLGGGGLYIWALRKDNARLRQGLDIADGVVTIQTKRVDTFEASTLEVEKEIRNVEDDATPSAAEHLAKLRAKYKGNRP